MMFRWRGRRNDKSRTVMNVQLVVGKKLLQQKQKFSVNWSIYNLYMQTLTYHHNNVWLKVKRIRFFDQPGSATSRSRAAAPLHQKQSVEMFRGWLLGAGFPVIFHQQEMGSPEWTQNLLELLCILSGLEYLRRNWSVLLKKGTSGFPSQICCLHYPTTEEWQKVNKQTD